MCDVYFRQFELRYPEVTGRIKQVLKSDPYFIMVELTDGSINEYDILNESIRKLPENPNNLTEQEYRREFGLRLRKKLLYCDITQTELSEMTGIPQTTISKYIRGVTTPSSYTLDKIAKALNCSTDDFRFFWE